MLSWSILNGFSSFNSPTFFSTNSLTHPVSPYSSIFFIRSRNLWTAFFCVCTYWTFELKVKLWCTFGWHNIFATMQFLVLSQLSYLLRSHITYMLKSFSAFQCRIMMQLFGIRIGFLFTLISSRVNFSPISHTCSMFTVSYLASSYLPFRSHWPNWYRAWINSNDKTKLEKQFQLDLNIFWTYVKLEQICSKLIILVICLSKKTQSYTNYFSFN